MKNLIPHFIQEQYECGVEKGNFTGFALFVDLSGFTGLTETLLKKEKAGAERLSDILNAIFGPMVSLVYKTGGFIPHFAGDAYFGLFPQSTTPLCAEEVIAIASEHFHLLQKASPAFKEFSIKIKIGISHGNIEWGIVGNETKSFYFRGQAIMGCANCQALAQSGEIILDGHFKKLLNQTEGLKAIEGKTCFKMSPLSERASRSLPSTTVVLPPMSRPVLGRFLPEAILRFNQQGEFRTVVAAFLSFEGLASHEELDELASVVLQKVADFSGYFKEMEFADKGGVMVILFGAPVSFENNAERAVEFLLTLNEELLPLENHSKLKKKAGVATGIAYTGLVGGDERCQYAAVGNRINIAARIMMKARWGEILVDENVAKTQQFTFEYKGNMAYKGLEKKIPT
ncbi:MAG TPA: adenylate/guanylate cyclase domain-containing protein, partial [Bacteroidetes bacterium]|nr:adenylate/guanylate cyclase domain-containing protein [Bacteroidota bacterium]